MILYVVLVALVALQGVKLRLRSFNEDYLSKNDTDAVWGIFILLIMASHFVQYVELSTTLPDLLYLRLRGFLGQAVVTCFLFYSGYGVALSAKQKGEEYVRAMPRRRIFPTMFVYDCSVLLYLILQLWRGRSVSLKQFVLAILAWQGIGNSDWYIFAIVGLYTITWLVLRGRKLDAVAVARITVATLAFLLALLCAGKGAYWYDTLLSYPLGMWFFLYKEKIDRFLSKGTHYWPITIVIAAAFILVHKVWNRSLFFYILTMLLFTLCAVLFTMKVQLRSPALLYCGRHLRGLYLLQRLPFIFLGDYLPWKSGPGIYIYFALGIVLIFLLDALFSRAMTFLCAATSVKVHD